MLLSNLDVLVTAPGGVAKLRELILTLALQGKLLPGEYADQRWEKNTLADIGEWGSGGTPSKSYASYYEGGDIPWLVIGDLNDGIVTKAETCITQAGLENSSAKLIPAGTLLVAMYGSIGKLGITGISCATNQAIAHCRPKSDIVDLKYLFYFLRGIRNSLLSRGQGLAQQNISQKILRSVEILVPPLVEQTRIVTRIEELMYLCDALEAKGQLESTQHAQLVSTLLGTLTASTTPEELAEKWQRVAQHFDLLLDRPEAIDALEQTLLQLAVRGLLVPQDPTDEPASALLQRIRAEKDRLIATGQIKRDKPLPPIADEEKPFELPEGWEWVRVGNIGVTQTGGTPASNRPEFFDGDFPFIGPGQITVTGEILPPEKFVSEAGRFESAVAEPGDILMVCIGGSIGKSACATYATAFNQQINSIHPLLALNSYVLSAMTARDFVMSVIGASTGSATPIISKGKWDLLLVPMPPLAEQSRIVARLAQMRRLCVDLRQRLTAAQSSQSRLVVALVSEIVAS